MKKDRKTHFPDLAELPERLFQTAAGKPVFKYKSFCGFKNRTASGKLKEVDCLLCLRSIISQVRRAASAEGSAAPAALAQDLFAQISAQRKKENYE